MLFSGVHHFYLKRHGWGAMYVCTLGLFGIGWLSDLWRLPGIVDDTNKYLKRRYVNPTRPIKVADAYVLILCPITGMLGGQHYMLGRYLIGLFYTCTLGVMLIGWLVDWCRMDSLVKEHNTKVKFK